MRFTWQAREHRLCVRFERRRYGRRRAAGSPSRATRAVPLDLVSPVAADRDVAARMSTGVFCGSEAAAQRGHDVTHRELDTSEAK